jgi:hypothetical protein
MNAKSARIIAIAAASVVALALIGIALYARRPAEPVKLQIPSLDQKTHAELTRALADFNAQQKRYVASLVDAGGETGAKQRVDLVLGPYQEGAVMWRTVGWRLWTRLETLAGIEGELGRSLIRPLREGSVDGSAFEKLLSDARAPGRAALVLPAAPASYPRALELYFEKLGWDAPARIRQWTAAGLLLRVPTPDAAFEALRRGKAVFLVGSDGVGGWLGRAADNHPEGFALPGSGVPGASWAIGRADAFSVPPGQKLRKGTADLAVYLTSKGVARGFAEKLPGAYYSWTEAPAKGKLPTVDAPTEFLQLE